MTGDVKYQWEIMTSLGMTDDEIKDFLTVFMKAETCFQSKLKAMTGDVKYRWEIMTSLGMTDDEIKDLNCFYESWNLFSE